MFDITQPFSGLQNGAKVNGATVMIMQRQTDLDNAVKLFVKLHRYGYDINSADLQQDTFELLNLTNLTSNEHNYILKEVNNAIS